MLIWSNSTISFDSRWAAFVAFRPDDSVSFNAYSFPSFFARNTLPNAPFRSCKKYCLNCSYIMKLMINATQSFTNLTNNLIISDFSHLSTFDSEFGLRLSHNGVDWVSNSHTLRFEMYRTERSIWFWHIPWHILSTSLTLLINTKWDKLIVGQEETWLIASTSLTRKTLNWKWSKTIKGFVWTLCR